MTTTLPRDPARPLSTGTVAREELIHRARALVPRLRERAVEAERLRRLPESTARELLDAGLYRIYLPRRYGGYELDFQLQVDIAAELGRGCGSTAWVWSILASHHWVQGMMDPRAQDEVWEADPDALIASAFPGPGATVTPVDGGLLLDGRWSFASGIDCCDWVHLNLMVPATEGQPAHHRFGLVPRTDCELVDDWFTTGLRGTGSRSLDLHGVFVPGYRTLSTQDCIGGPTPGSQANPNPLYRMPLFSLFAHAIAAPAVGIALGALEAMVDKVRRGSARSGALLHEQPTVQLRLAEASAETDAALALLRTASEEGTAAAAGGVMPPLADRVRWRRNGAYAATLCLRAVERLHPLAGASSLHEHHPYQRAVRDVHAVSAHIALTWDVQGANYGGVLLGHPSTDPKL
jgi:3-hydroxy-9,10-secoandrosta-1,3,5(10)-triene-9,17-dione monooxygenase